MIREENTLERLRLVASKLTIDPKWQMELFSAMHAFLQRMRVTEPGLKTIWYVKGCEQHGRSYLKQLQGPDMAVVRDEDLIARVEPQSVLPHLSPRQQEVFDHLRTGHGVRETARLLGISHPAVIKLRRKIVRAIAKNPAASPVSGPQVPVVAPAL